MTDISHLPPPPGAAPVDISHLPPPPQEPSLGQRLSKALEGTQTGALVDTAKMVGSSALDVLSGKTRLPIASQVPVVGELGKMAGAKFLSATTGQPYGDVRDQQAAEDQRFSQEHPAINAMSGAAGMMALPMPPVIAAAKGANLAVRAATGVGNAAVRTGVNTAVMGADAALKGEDPVKAMESTALLSGGLEAGMGALGAIGPKVAKKAVSSLGGVAPRNVEAYMANPEAVKAAQNMSFVDIKNMVDSDLARMDIGLEDARLAHGQALKDQADVGSQATTRLTNARAKVAEKVGDAKDALRDASTQAIQELREKVVPKDLATGLSAGLQNQKAHLGALSEQAEDALARTPGTVNRDELRGMLRDAGAGIGVRGPDGTVHLIGDEANSAVQSLGQLDQRLAAMPEQISFGDTRNIMRQVRADVNNAGGYGMGTGSFNSTLNRAKKGFAESISDHLKTKSEDYAKVMEQMAPLSDSLGKMDQYFGNPETALASLQAATKGNGARGRNILEALQNHAALTGDDAALLKLAEYSRASETLTNPVARQQMLESLPEFRQLQRAKAAYEQMSPQATSRAAAISTETSPATAAVGQTANSLADAQALRKQLAGWSPASSEGRLKTVMANSQNPAKGIEQGRAVDLLSAVNGQNDYRQLLGNKSVGDAFDKGFTHGSRNVNLWSLLGGLFGGAAHMNPGARALTHAMGGGLGAAIDSFGPKMTQHGLDAYMGLRNAVPPYMGARPGSVFTNPTAAANQIINERRKDPMQTALQAGQ